MKKTRVFSLVLAVLMALSTFVIGVSAADGIAKSDNVVFVANAGSDSAAGTVDAPVQTMQKAVEKLSATGGVIVVMGQVTIESTNSVMPVHSGVITVTSFYDGVDYRMQRYGADATFARLIFNQGSATAFAFQGDYVFDYIDFCVPSASKKSPAVAGYWNDVTFGANVKTVYEGIDGTQWFDGSFNDYVDTNKRNYPPYYMAGQNSTNIGIEGDCTIVDDVVLNFAGGDWMSVRIGDRDVVMRNTVNCDVTLNISGGNYAYWTGNYANNSATNLSVMGTYQINTGDDFVSTINITGGNFYGEISAHGNVGTANKPMGDCTHNGVVNVNFLGGTFYRDRDAVGPVFVTSQFAPGSFANLAFGANAAVNVTIDVSKLTLEGSVAAFKLVGKDGVSAFFAVSEKSDKIVLDATVNEASVKYGPLASDTPDTTEAVVTTEAAVTTEAVVTTEAAVTTETAVTTEATVTTATPTEPEVTPPTGDFSVLAVFAAAVAACVAAVLVIKKREN